MALAQKNTNEFDMPHETDIAWCPGCGNFPILQTLKKSLKDDLAIDPKDLVLVSGIGQAAKLPQYVKTNMFNGLHGRALPVATGIKAANPELTVVVTSGDGDVYGEGGNHFIHTIRRNTNITVIVHNNMIYGLTKGQASPTSEKGLVTPTQPQGVYVDPLNPLALALSLNASFVARANAGDPAHAQKVISAAIAHKGFSIVDIFQACVVFNKVNTYKWFQDRVYELDASHDQSDRQMAFARALEEDMLPMGIFYQDEGRETFEEAVGVYDNDQRPLYARERQWERVAALISAKK